MYAALFAIVMLAVPLSDFQRRAFDDFAQMGAAFVAASCVAYAALRGRRRARWAWGALAAGCAAWGAGGAAWTAYEVVLRVETPFPSLADLGYLGLLPFMLCGLLLLASADRASLRARTALDAVAIVATSASFVWLLVLRDLYGAADSDLVAKAIGGSYPLGDLVLFFGLFITLNRQRRGRAAVVLATLAAGLMLFMAADVGFAYLTLNEAYVTGSPVDFGWLGGFLLIGFAGILQGAWNPDYSAQGEPLVPPVWRQALPLLLLLFALAQAGAGWRHDDYTFIALIGVALASVLARQWLVLQDNFVLNRRLAEAGRHLEERVRERTEELEASLEAHARLASILEATPDLVATADMQGRLLYLNGAARRTLGLEEAQALPDAGLLDWHPEAAAALVELQGLPTALSEGAWSGETLILARSGHEFPVSQVVLAHRGGDGRPRYLSTIARDITERKEMEDQLRYQAFHDPLTGLANRARFVDRLDHALSRARRSYTTAAVLFLDLDHFKSINDRFSHSVGDRVLTEAAERLRASIRPGDTAARFGGDEFAVLLEDVGGELEALAVAERIMQALRAPVEVEGRQLFPHASIGVRVSGPELGADAVIRDADLAMYAAKREGRNRVVAYRAGMHVSLVERLDLLADLQGAVERGEFVIEYQPAVDLVSGRLKGMEALVRWQHPTRGTIPPLQFIALAEESGEILPLGRWVLRNACEQAREWQRRYPGAESLRMAVNVSVRQLQQSSFVADVAEALRASGVDPASLVLEVTESATMDDVFSMAARLRELKALGVRLAIDDFGTGYSSLGYLRRLPFDILKIDKSFIDGLGAEAGESDHLVKAILAIAHTLHLDVVAEGVEHPAQAERLRALDCDSGQGFLFGRPLGPAAAERIVAAWAQAMDAAA